MESIFHTYIFFLYNVPVFPSVCDFLGTAKPVHFDKYVVYGP